VSLAAGPAAVGHPAIEPYDRGRHRDGPWQVVNAVFLEYGFPFAESDYDADLQDPAAFYDGRRGWFAVAVDQATRVVGCAGVTDEGAGVFELHRLYVLAEARRTGTGSRLAQWVLDTARARGGAKMVLFSDTRFLDAHRLYERMGFRCWCFRYSQDPWSSPEWGFELDLVSPAVDRA
jgi:GNAT superfamily N-acetyltransferase